MAKIAAVKCDACDHIDVPTDNAEIPNGWFLLDLYKEGEGNLEARVYCSWACIADVAQHQAGGPTKRRKRRTKAEMLAAAQVKGA
jgi:hypothetical protein